jgi:hypothetical protein
LGEKDRAVHTRKIGKNLSQRHADLACLVGHAIGLLLNEVRVRVDASHRPVFTSIPARRDTPGGPWAKKGTGRTGPICRNGPQNAAHKLDLSQSCSAR